MPLGRLLIVRTDRLGETLLVLPALAALRRALPETRIVFAASPLLVDLLRHAPAIDAVLPYESAGPWWARCLRAAAAWRAQRADAVIVCNPMKELHLATWLSGIRRRVGYARKWGFLLTERLEDNRALGRRHEVESNAAMLRPLGIDCSSGQQPPFLSFSREEEQALKDKLSSLGVSLNGPFVAVHPWTSNPAKQWPLKNFRLLASQMVERLGVGVVIIGGEADQDAALVSGGRLVNLCGRLSLSESALALRMACVLVSNDSGPVHLAAAVGTPTVVLFGAIDPAAGPRRWGPWGEGHTVIWKSSIDAITVDEVFITLQRQWQLRTPRHNAF